METRNPEPESLAESLAGDDGVCPIPLTHDRLEEVHYWWHEMARNYHEPNQFRYSLGALVQAGRSVSFMLQKEKHVFADFRWYQSWFEYFKKRVRFVLAAEYTYRHCASSSAYTWQHT